MALEEIKIRKYDRRIDRHRVEDLEQRCEVGSAESSATLIVDTMGDPTCRIRHCQIYKMLVAELNNKELVGMVQGTIKIVTVHLQHQRQSIVGYILGLRVSPLHRQRGIALSLVKKMEEWFILNHVDLAYMATDKDNEASVKLFTEKLQYVKFRTPSILVNPVSHHLMHLSPNIKIMKLNIEHAERLYRRFMGSTEFFPQDMDRILKNKLSLGTWIAYWQGDSCRTLDLDQYFPTSWAMLSVWNSGQLFKLRVAKPSLACKMYAKSSSFIDRFFPCIKFPFIPNMFKPFGFYFVYGLYQEGPKSGSLMQSLCKLVHNMAIKCQDCKMVVTEIGGCDDLLRHHIPHRQLLSCPEDLWCIKDLKSDEKLFDLTRTLHPRALFIDPREV